MNYYNKLQNKCLLGFFLVLLGVLSFVFVPIKNVNASVYTNCITSNHNYDNTENGSLVGTVLITSGTTNQNNTGYMDCNSYESDNPTKWEFIIDYSRSFLNALEDFHLNQNNTSSCSLYGDNGYLIEVIYGYPVITFTSTGYDDGIYFFNCGSFYPHTEFYSFYIKDEKIYENINDIPQQTNETLAPSLGSLNFGLAIVIVLISLGGMFSIYNLISKKKKPWQR